MMARRDRFSGLRPDEWQTQHEALKEKRRLLLQRIQNVTTIPDTLDASEKSTEAAKNWAEITGSLTLRLPDYTQPIHPTQGYCELVVALERILGSSESEAILCWPAPNVSVAALHALSTLSIWFSAPAFGERDNHADLRSLRGLYFPWTSRARQPLKNIYACKDAISGVHRWHIQKYTDGADHADPIYDLHLALIRVADLTGDALDGKRYIEFCHPTLDELVPKGAIGASSSGLLYRVKSKTQLRELSGGETAEAPNTAPYYLFGVSAEANYRRALTETPKPIHFVALDLTQTGRNRLKGDWKEPTSKFLVQCRSHLPGVPVLAITDDPWVHRELMWDILKTHTNTKGKRPAKHDALFFQNNRLVANRESEQGEVVGCTEVRARGFSGNLDGVLNSLAELKARARRLQDVPAVALLQELSGLLKRCANLPGSVSSLGNYVASETNDDAAVNIMGSYQASAVIARLEALEGPLAHSRREALTHVCKLARNAWDGLNQSTPMSLLMTDELQPFLRNSSKTIVLFRKAMLSDYALQAVCVDPEIGEDFQKRVDKQMIRFIDEIGLREASALPRRERAQIKTMVLVSPTRNQLLAHLTNTWLPDRLVVLADALTLKAVSRDAELLAIFPSLARFKQRFELLARATREGAEIVDGARVQLDALDAPPIDVDFPTAKLIDLSGGSSASDLITIETEDRQIILARPRTQLVEYDESGPVPIFKPLLARDVDEGDAICVISDDFIDMARARLDIASVATEEIRSYHQLVVQLYSTIEAANDREKRRKVAALMNERRTNPDEREVSEENVRYWVDLEDELNLPLEEVTPHAPQHSDTFARFMAVLGVSQTLSEHYWRWAIIGTRSNRLKAAHRLHEAYLGVLISPHSAEAEHPRRAADIRALRVAAEMYISKVARVRSAGRGDS